MRKLAIISTHPIQYYVPIFQRLANLLEIKVFYTWGADSVKKYDPGFGKEVEWDIPLLDGYDYVFEENCAKEPGSHHFKGIKNPKLIGDIKAFEPDAILIFGWAYQSHLQVLRYFKGKVPLWFRGDSTLLDHQNGLKSFFKRYFLKWVYRHVDMAFYVGEANKVYFQYYGLKETQLCFAPHAVDNERFAENRYKESFELRNRLGIEESDVLFLFAGKLEEKKNPLLLLQAFLDLDAPHTHLLFVGNGELEERLKASTPLSLTTDALTSASTPLSLTLPSTHQLTDEQTSPMDGQALHTSTPLSVTRRVHFMDFQNQSQMPVVYQACDVFCLPSQGPGETWGLAVNEAMACGKAILVSNKVGCGKDLVKEGFNGYFFRFDDIKDLIKKLNHLSSNKDKLKILGDMSKEIIADFNLNKIIDKISFYLIKI